MKLHCLTTTKNQITAEASPAQFSSSLVSHLKLCSLFNCVCPPPPPHPNHPPTRHRAQCSQRCGVKYNADEAFKANAI